MNRWLRQIVYLSLFVAVSSFASTIDSPEDVKRATNLIEQGHYALARTYLAPALIDYRLNPGKRSHAYYLRGYSFYAEDLFVSASKDYNRALEFNPDNPSAIAALARLYFQGQGVDQDRNVAYELFLKAARLGHVSAQFYVGYASLGGYGTEMNVEIARTWLGKASERGHTAAMTHLAKSYREGVAEIPEPATAKVWYEKAYAAGAVSALVALAYMYQKGEFGEADLTKSMELFAQAAEAGSGPGMVGLGHSHLTGTGVNQSYERALDLFQQAAAKDTPSSFMSLGHMSEVGLGMPKNLEDAKHWYRRGAETGLAAAQLRLAYLLLADGKLEAQAEALNWFDRAVAQDHPQAHNDYAWLLATSRSKELRNGSLALEHATRAVAKKRTAAYLDTLAAAHAELGQFAEAIQFQEQALSLVSEQQIELAAELQKHLDAYHEAKPWRE
ncbi:MAG: tetratricopeptide repeat protein [bacterium]|nr:tetratricopeptide repeat protein [bacterium]